MLIFTNEQLAKMVTERVTSKRAMAAISGIGQAKLEQYGPIFLPLLQKLLGEVSK